MPAQKRKQLLKNDEADTPASSDELPPAKKKGFVALKQSEDDKIFFLKNYHNVKETLSFITDPWLH